MVVFEQTPTPYCALLCGREQQSSAQRAARLHGLRPASSVRRRASPVAAPGLHLLAMRAMECRVWVVCLGQQTANRL
eukprot:scaffold12578_cov128-Isochrysis_galbana.AAC.3